MSTDYLMPASILGKEIESNRNSFYMKCKKNQRHNITTDKQVFFLKSGTISIYRMKDDMLTMDVNSPAVLGLSFIKEFTPMHYFRCTSECELHVLGLNHTMRMLNEKNLWEQAFYNVSELVQHYMKRDALVIQKNSHAIVMEHLRVIWSMDDDTREKTSIYTYILERNIISRSAIHKVVTDLINQSVINIHRGKLTAFNDRRR